VTARTLLHSPAEGVTERFDPIACMDERTRQRAMAADPTEPGRYVEVPGTERALLLPIGTDALHIGRGLNADLRLDDNSVSRKHAILVARGSRTRILDDRSSNGTIVNGRRVQQAELHNGDVITIGRVLLRYIEV
jgi:pSer/pThr/pTyr-binding forkhead associated (FHA) protein